MALEIKMPALSPTMEEGTLAKWLVADGDDVRSGDVIAEIETDKATMEVEAIEDGKIGQILVSAGTQHVKVNAVIAMMLEDGESANDLKLLTPDAPAEPVAAPVADDATEFSKTASETIVSPAAEAKWSGSSTSLTVRESLRDAMAIASRSDSRTVSDVELPDHLASAAGLTIVSEAVLENSVASSATGAATGSAGASGVSSFRSLALSPSSSIIAITAFTFTCWVPADTKIWPIFPSSMASTSIVALSVSISAITSPERTSSPSATSHFASVPSSIVGDKAGILISRAMIIPLQQVCCRSAAAEYR